MEQELNIKLINSWDNINIEMFQKIYNIDKIEDKFEKIKQYILLFTDIKEDIYNKIPIPEINTIFNEICQLLNNKPKTELPKIIEVDNVKYGLQEDLFEQTNEQFLISENFKGNFIENLHILLAIYYRPIVNIKPLFWKRILWLVWNKGWFTRKIKRNKPFPVTENNYEIEPFNIKTLNDRAELFKQKLNVQILFGFQSFFLNFTVYLMKHIQSSVMKTMKTN